MMKFDEISRSISSHISVDVILRVIIFESLRSIFLTCPIRITRSHDRGSSEYAWTNSSHGIKNCYTKLVSRGISYASKFHVTN